MHKSILKPAWPWLSILLVLTLMPLDSRGQGQTTARQIAANSHQAVVKVQAYSGGEEIRFGSGFFIREDGVFVTNVHVIAGADKLSVELANGEIFDNVYGLGLDERRDLAVLKIPISNVPVLEIADDRSTEVGDTVYVMGNPLGLSRTFSDGLLSARRLEQGVSYLQLTAPISEGSSGGPVLNVEGKVIGVSTLTMEEGQNLNLAVPAHHASDLLALGSEPIGFETFAARLPQSNSVSNEDRAAETASLRSALPAGAEELFVDMNEYEQQVATRLLAFASLLSNRGWELRDEIKSGALAEEEVGVLEINLRRGSYSALAVCDDDCVDLDLIVFGPNEEEMGSNIEVNADALVPFEVIRRGKYLIGAKMISCKVANCAYSISVLKKK
jgi:hypothetical protein